MKVLILNNHLRVANYDYIVKVRPDEIEKERTITEVKRLGAYGNKLEIILFRLKESISKINTFNRKDMLFYKYKKHRGIPEGVP